MTDREKVMKLRELIPDIGISAAESWFPFKRESALHELYGESVYPRRRLIIETVIAIEDGIVDSPLYKALS